jgi:hypothetical protein
MLLEGSDAEGLSKLIEKYPYSSTIYVLNSLVQQKIKSVDFDELLKKSAAHSVDRARLYELLHGEKEGKTEKETERAEVLREKIIETESAEVALPETVLPEEIEKDVAVEASLVKESGAGSEKKSDDIAPEVALKSAEDKADQEKQSLKNSDEELNKIIISNIVGKAYELAPEEMLPSSGNEISENEKSEDLGTIAKGFAPKAKRQPEPEIEEETDEIEPVDTSKMSFTEWLAYKKLMSDPDVKSSEKRAKKPSLRKENEKLRHRSSILQKMPRRA